MFYILYILICILHIVFRDNPEDVCEHLEDVCEHSPKIFFYLRIDGALERRYTPQRGGGIPPQRPAAPPLGSRLRRLILELGK